MKYEDRSPPASIFSSASRLLGRAATAQTSSSQDSVMCPVAKE